MQKIVVRRVYTFVFVLLAIALSFLLRFAASDYPFVIFVFPIFRIWAYLMMVILETRRAH